MRCLITFSLLTFLISCKNEQEKLKSSIIKNSETYITSKVVSLEQYSKLESIKFIKTDTISAFDESEMFIKYILAKTKKNLELSKLEQEKAGLYNDVNKMLGKSGNDLTIRRTAQEANEHLDSAKYYSEISNNILKKLPTLDTIKPVYFRNIFFIKVKLKNSAIESDTIPIITDLSGNIVEKKEIIKILHSKYK